MPNWKPHRFSIGRHDKEGNIVCQIHRHHPLKGTFPNTTFPLPSSLHAVVSAWQRQKPTKTNLKHLENFILSLCVEWFLIKAEVNETKDEAAAKAV